MLGKLQSPRLALPSLRYVAQSLLVGWVSWVGWVGTIRPADDPILFSATVVLIRTIVDVAHEKNIKGTQGLPKTEMLPSQRPRVSS